MVCRKHRKTPFMDKLPKFHPFVWFSWPILPFHCYKLVYSISIDINNWSVRIFEFLIFGQNMGVRNPNFGQNWKKLKNFGLQTPIFWPKIKKSKIPIKQLLISVQRCYTPMCSLGRAKLANKIIQTNEIWVIFP